MTRLTEDIYLVAAVRTPIGKFGGGLSALTAAQLGTASAKATIERSGCDPAAIDEVIFGNARQAGVGPNVARQAAIKSGLRHEVPAYTVNQACGSGLRAIMNAADQIRLGQASIVLAGGTALPETMNAERRVQNEELRKGRRPHAPFFILHSSFCVLRSRGRVGA
jgi:acetyl-CoA C-acetyltransferase